MIHREPDRDYIVSLRREFHRIPEVGFDLPKTLAVVKRELEALGIPYTDRYGKASLVGYLGREDAGKTVALRADMDALPVEENTGLPFSSTHEGKMHACGHDCHIAMLLGTAKMLKEVEDELPCRVLLLFQAAEEYAPGGAKLMAEDGVLTGVDAVAALHVNPTFPVGRFSVNSHVMSASSHGFFLDIYGKSAHVATPHRGVDAIAIACRIYNDIQIMRSREMPPLAPAIIGVGEFHGGAANNVICDHVHMHGTIRAHETAHDEYMYRRIGDIAKSIAEDAGGRAELVTTKHYPVLKNDPETAREVAAAIRRAMPNGTVITNLEPSMGAQDLSFFLANTKGAFFRLGAREEGEEIVALHNCRFSPSEKALVLGPAIFYEYVMRGNY
jgi:amidohydrolase